ncbi:hypothetical protein [Hydrogenimonas sp.]
MVNAKEEILDTIHAAGKFLEDIAYARICVLDDNFDKKEVWIFCKHGLQKNLRALDFDYDEGYGAQELFGVVVFTDGSWLERYEYDGAESWVHKRTPTEIEVFGECDVQ